MKLNMGCGMNKCEGYVNVDMYPDGAPDVLWDLERTPWPWESDSVSEILFNHSLEHIGADSRVFLKMMQELYRVCRPGAGIQINVPHPRHDNFIGDPTHVRVVTPQMLTLFSRQANLEWKAKGAANSPLALYLNVDFEIDRVEYMLEEPYASLMRAGEIGDDELNVAVRERNNVVNEIRITLRVIK